MAAGGELFGHAHDTCLMAIAPHRLLANLEAIRTDAQVVPGSVALQAFRRLAAGLLAADIPVGEAQGRLFGHALLELLTAALFPLSSRRAGLAPRREASLFDRLVAYVDHHLADQLDVERLCEALFCSRSALYRAASSAGGVATLVNERRLTAIHRCLRNPDEQRAIGVIARAYGLADPAQFSRSFKKHYGITAVRLRRDHRTITTAGRS
jgi:AraC-like DNA-binding protein